MKNKYKNETLLANVTNNTVKNIFENGMMPKLIQYKTITNIKTDRKRIFDVLGYQQYKRNNVRNSLGMVSTRT
jgi:CRISPR/Cas system CMR-associated protein Cmr3 (group 5 of RAMP superfamily)